MQNPPDPNPNPECKPAVDPAIDRLIDIRVKAGVKAALEAALKAPAATPAATPTPAPAPVTPQSLVRRLNQVSKREAQVAEAQLAAEQLEAQSKAALAKAIDREEKAKDAISRANAKTKEADARLAEAKMAEADNAKVLADIMAKMAKLEARTEAADKAEAAAAAEKKPQALPSAAPAEPESAGAAPAELAPAVPESRLPELGILELRHDPDDAAEPAVPDVPMLPFKHKAKRISEKAKRAHKEQEKLHFRVLEDKGYYSGEAQHALQSALILMNKAPAPEINLVRLKNETAKDFIKRFDSLYNMAITDQIVAAEDMDRRNKLIKDAALTSQRVRRDGNCAVSDKPYLALFYLEPDAEKYVTSSLPRQVRLAKSVAKISAAKSAYSVAIMIDLLFNDLEAWRKGLPCACFTRQQREAFELVKGLYEKDSPRFYPVPGIIRTDKRLTVNEMAVFGLRKSLWCGRASPSTKRLAAALLPYFPQVYIAFPGNEFCATMSKCLAVAKARQTPELTLKHLQNHYNEY